MSYETPDHNMEMPTRCQKCGGWFDLNDGVGSEKWFPNTIICDECGREEEKEIERDEQIEDLKNSLSDAEFTVKECKEQLAKLGVLQPAESTGNQTFTHEQLKTAIWEELKEADHCGENNDRVYKILGIVQGAVERIKPIESTGAGVWVKASDFKIEYGPNYYAKWLDGKVKATGWFQKSDGTFFWSVLGYIPILKSEYEHLYILDETAPTAHHKEDAAQSGKEEAILQLFQRILNLANHAHNTSGIDRLPSIKRLTKQGIEMIDPNNKALEE